MKQVNKTRQSKSIPIKLIKDRKPHLLPIYYLLMLSSLGREGIENSGSFEFADHIYKNKAKGYFGVGKGVDGLILKLPSSRSFRNRYLHSKQQVADAIINNDKKVIISVPSGIPRDLIEVAEKLHQEQLAKYQQVEFYCIDIDPSVHKKTKELFPEQTLEKFTFITADALDQSIFPNEVDIVTSMGFTEFLDDQQVTEFFCHCSDVLNKDGILITSATVKHKTSEYLMRNIAELYTNYREEDAMRDILKLSGFAPAMLERDDVGYQVLVTANKRP